MKKEVRNVPADAPKTAEDSIKEVMNSADALVANTAKFESAGFSPAQAKVLLYAQSKGLTTEFLENVNLSVQE